MRVTGRNVNRARVHNGLSRLDGHTTTGSLDAGTTFQVQVTTSTLVSMTTFNKHRTAVSCTVHTITTSDVYKSTICCAPRGQTSIEHDCTTTASTMTHTSLQQDTTTGTIRASAALNQNFSTLRSSTTHENQITTFSGSLGVSCLGAVCSITGLDDCRSTLHC